MRVNIGDDVTVGGKVTAIAEENRLIRIDTKNDHFFWVNPEDIKTVRPNKEVKNDMPEM